jgi:hypothetical protein
LFYLDPHGIDQDFGRAGHIFLSFLKVNKSTHFKTDFPAVEVYDGSSFTLYWNFLVRLIHSIQKMSGLVLCFAYGNTQAEGIFGLFWPLLAFLPFLQK